MPRHRLVALALLSSSCALTHDPAGAPASARGGASPPEGRGTTRVRVPGANDGAGSGAADVMLAGEAQAPTPAVEAADAAGCAGDGAFDFALRGTGLDPWNGRLVGVVAAEPELSPGGRVTLRRVTLSARVTDGAFSVRCEHGLRENMNYPSYAVVVDANGDGRCSVGDLAHVMQFYGWVGDLEAIVAYGVDWGEIDGAGRPPLPIGVHDSTFCEAYFP